MTSCLPISQVFLQIKIFTPTYISTYLVRYVRMFLVLVLVCKSKPIFPFNFHTWSSSQHLPLHSPPLLRITLHSKNGRNSERPCPRQESTSSSETGTNGSNVTYDFIATIIIVIVVEVVEVVPE